MGSQRTDYHLAGNVVPFPDLADYETANDSGTDNSAYSSANPRPGTPTPDSTRSTLVPVISGAQDADLVLTVQQGGTPGADGDACQVGYRYASEAAEQDRGWTACNGFDDWDSILWTTSATSDYFDACVHPDDQRVMVAHGTTGGTSILIKVWSPTTATWSAATGVSASGTAAALCALPNGRVVLATYAGRVFRSDDFGATWDAHSTESIPTLENIRMVAVDGEILLVGLTAGTSELQQYASSDGGCTFSLVEVNTDLGTKFSISSLPSGQIVLSYRRFADGFPCTRVISSPWDSIAAADVAVIKAAACTDVVTCADPDGVLWSHSTYTALLNVLFCHVSLDSAGTWGEFDFGAALVSTSSTDSLRPLKAVSTQGQVMVVAKFVASTGTNDPSIVSLRFGGWSNAPYGLPSGESGIRSRYGFGAHATLTPIVYTPIELPNNNGWTAAGAGTGTLASGRCNIATVANNRSYAWNPGTNLSQITRAGLKVNSGGSVTARDVALSIEVANGANAYRIDVRFSTTQFRVFDPHASAGAGTTLATITYDTTTELDILVVVSNTTLSSYVLYKRPYEAAWTEAWSGTLTTDTTPAASGNVEFGHISAGTANSDWRYVATCETGTTSYLDASRLGRPTGTVSTPLHSEVSDGIRVGRLSAIGGLAALGETFDVPARYDYPGDAIYPQVSPSPSAKWRTTDKTQQRRAYFLDQATTLGELHPAMIAIGCNFRTAYLEEEQAGWNTVGTLDLAEGFTGLNYSYNVAGVLMAAAGGTSPARYIPKNALAGGYAVIETGGGASQVAYRILRNDPGYWSSSTDRKQVRIYLDGVAGTEDTTGQCDLVWPSGVLLVYESVIRLRRRWRIRIPGNQVTPDDYYSAGILTIGALHVPGAAPDWGYSEESVPRVSSRTTPAGVSYVRQLGPPTRSLTFGWSSGVDLARIRGSATDGDWIGITGSMPMASAEDVPWWCEGMQEYMRSGEIPAVWLKALPAATATVTDPSLIFYGRLISSVGTDHELGDEDTGELTRPISWTIEGIR